MTDLNELISDLEDKYDMTDSEIVRQTARNVAHLQD